MQFADVDVEVCTRSADMQTDVVEPAFFHLEGIGVEVLFATFDKKGKLHIQEKFDFTASEAVDGVAKYTASINPDRSGIYQVAGRIYAKNSKLPHRQDFELVRWL